jgi:hypothetical protein
MKFNNAVICINLIKKKQFLKKYTACFVNCSLLLSKKTAMLLNAFYDFGNKIGPMLTWFFIIAMTVELIFVMAKYLFTKD